MRLAKAKAIQATKVKVVHDVVEESPKKASTPRKERTPKVDVNKIVVEKDVFKVVANLFLKTRKRCLTKEGSAERLVYKRIELLMEGI